MRGLGRRRAAGAALAGALAVALSAAPARGQDVPAIPSPNLEALLPDTPAPASVQPYPVPHCRRAGLRCLTSLERRLRRQWRALDAACDHRAVFSLAYLRITQGLRRAIRDGLIRDPRWMAYVVAEFSNRYFAIFAAHEQGQPVPGSWQLAYDLAAHGDTSAPQDVLLASNAHTQHDLPFVYAAMGTRTPDGRSRKPDHDAVNAVNDAVFGGIEDYGGAHYDPQFQAFRLAPLGLDRIGTLQMIQGWREGAWRNAVRLLNARSEADRARVVASIDANADAWAHLIAAPAQPGYRATRDAYCRAHRGD
jgi:hypothetical protein